MAGAINSYLSTFFFKQKDALKEERFSCHTITIPVGPEVDVTCDTTNSERGKAKTESFLNSFDYPLESCEGQRLMQIIRKKSCERRQLMKKIFGKIHVLSALISVFGVASLIVEGTKVISLPTTTIGISAGLVYLAIITNFVTGKILFLVRDINDCRPGVYHDNFIKWTRLHEAAAKGEGLKTRLLLWLGANPIITTVPTIDFPYSRTPLNFIKNPGESQSKAHIKVMKLLEKAVLDIINVPEDCEETPPHSVVRVGYLLRGNCDERQRLMQKESHEKQQLMKKIFEKIHVLSALISVFSVTSLILGSTKVITLSFGIPIGFGGLAIITELVANKILALVHDINNYSDDFYRHDFVEWTRLHEAVAKGRVQRTRLLLWLGADPSTTTDSCNVTLLHFANDFGDPQSQDHVKVMELLVKAGVDNTPK